MFEPGTIVDQYRIGERAGDGSYGTVYSVKNVVTGQHYAMKVVPLHGIGAERELSAVRHCRDLTHPHLIRLHHVGITSDTLYYTMDWAEDSYRTRPPSPEELLHHLPQLLDALKMLHSHGLIHRDIKPDNILWINGEAVLADIGLLSSGESISLAGSPGFIPPAVWKGERAPDEYDDLYALAKVIYCILSGKKPGEYPAYHGKRDAVSSLLMNAVFAVCAKNSKIRSTDDFLRLLTDRRPSPKRKLILGLSSGMILLLLTGGSLFFFRTWETKEMLFPAKPVIREQKQIPPVSMPEKKQEPEKKQKTEVKQEPEKKLPPQKKQEPEKKLPPQKKQGPEKNQKTEVKQGPGKHVGRWVPVDSVLNPVQIEYRDKWFVLMDERSQYQEVINKLLMQKFQFDSELTLSAQEELNAMPESEILQRCPEHEKFGPEGIYVAKRKVLHEILQRMAKEKHGESLCYQYFALQEQLTLLERELGLYISTVTDENNGKIPGLYEKVAVVYQEQIRLLKQASKPKARSRK